MALHKYRTLLVDSENCLGLQICTRIIQVKKWYGWVTFCTIEDECLSCLKRCDKIIEELTNGKIS